MLRFEVKVQFLRSTNSHHQPGLKGNRSSPCKSNIDRIWLYRLLELCSGRILGIVTSSVGYV